MVGVTSVRELRADVMYYFYSDVLDELPFSRDLRIRRVKKQEKQSYGELTDADHGYGLGLGGPLSFAIECVAPTSDEARSTISKLAIALLLFKRDKIKNDQLPFFRLDFGGSRTWDSADLPTLRTDELDHEQMKFPGFELRFDEIDNFKKSWDVCNGTWHPTLIVAGSRLLQTQQRVGETVFEDKLIDIMIACEALVLSGERDKGELIAHRLGKLQLGKSHYPEDRAMASLKLAYQLRNDIVHEGRLKKSHEDQLPTARFPDFVAECEELLRAGMVAYVDLMNEGKSKDDVIQYLGSP
ncbi:MAG: hypothetical protein ABSD99_12705 [Candidatus Bathyarchaeia archaeon]|jgi:hypothetical protein